MDPLTFGMLWEGDPGQFEAADAEDDVLVGGDETVGVDDTDWFTS